MVLGD